MTLEQAQRFAAEWVAAWNRHDVEAVLSHYTDDFTMTTPMIPKLLGIESGTLQGKKAVGDYWRAALQKIPDLKFALIETTCGVDTVSIYYHAVLGRRAIETFFFDQNGKVFKAFATYNA
jgi:ketosteroid isomerase-like protein